MIKKLTTVIIVILIVLAAALVFASYTNNNNSTNNSINNSNIKHDISTIKNAPPNTSNTTESQTKISPKEAKKIAQNTIGEPGITAGTPTISKINGEYVYNVPVIKNKAELGCISVDAHTGKVTGVAGGAP